MTTAKDFSTRTGTQAVDRAIAVLRCFEEDEQLGPTAVAQRLGLPVSTAHRIIGALHSAGMLGRDAFTGQYFLGPTTAVLGELALKRLGGKRKVHRQVFLSARKK